jgi:hypothetical protein
VRSQTTALPPICTTCIKHVQKYVYQVCLVVRPLHPISPVLSATPPLQHWLSEEEVGRVMSLYDLDGSGDLDRAEFQQLVSGCWVYAGGECGGERQPAAVKCALGEAGSSRQGESGKGQGDS